MNKNAFVKKINKLSGVYEALAVSNGVDVWLENSHSRAPDAHIYPVHGAYNDSQIDHVARLVRVKALR